MMDFPIDCISIKLLRLGTKLKASSSCCRNHFVRTYHVNWRSVIHTIAPSAQLWLTPLRAIASPDAKKASDKHCQRYQHKYSLLKQQGNLCRAHCTAEFQYEHSKGLVVLSDMVVVQNFLLCQAHNTDLSFLAIIWVFLQFPIKVLVGTPGGTHTPCWEWLHYTNQW